MSKVNLLKFKKVHFIGIGGIGVSAIARMMLLNGKKVSGSDSAPSPVTERIKRLGARIYIGHQESNIADGVGLVVYSPAVPGNNPELVKARREGIPAYSYPEMLGRISQGMYTIAVSGTHGKTTTTAMIAEIMIAAKKDPTVVVGSFLKKQKDNFVPGNSKYFVVEACEYRRSFLNLSPQILVITNIDNDHLDYYGNLKNIQKAFNEIALKVPKGGFIVCNPGDKRVKPALKGIRGKIIDYTKTKTNITIPIPGYHNIENAKAALAVAKLVDIDEVVVLGALKEFHGTWRRTEYKGTMKCGALLFDDYAHHPTEIRATLAGFRAMYTNKRIIVAFQPHLFSRTKLLLSDLAKSFRDVDEIILADIYAAREVDDGSISSRILAERMGKYHKNVHYKGGFFSIESYLRKKAKKDDIVITMGAGNIYEIGEKLITKKK
ncbi:MAG: UDP-N-acetylmuramate--L-alanine ligase [bacterium]|nr:UDP-N-acetylmuramate--L-alanine ligase [bacterium]